MIRHFTWQSGNDNDMGVDGWLMKGAPATFWPTSGLGVAHDMLEHFAGDDGSPEHELMALGALIRVRGHHAFAHSFVSLPKQIANETESLVLDFMRGRSEWLDPGPWQHSRKTDYIADEVEEIGELLSARADEADADERDRIRPFFTDEGVRRVRGWLVRGYRRACRRYGDGTPYNTREVFQRITDRANAASRHREPGDRLTVHADIKTGEVRLVVREAWE